ncbi:collagen-binding domain-containing protein [Spirosoma koreense]
MVLLSQSKTIQAQNPLVEAKNFNVFLANDATLTTNETDGAVGVGGNLTVNGNYQVATHSGVTIGGNTLGLLVGGGVKLQNGTLQVNSSTLAQIGACGGNAATDALKVWYKDNNNTYSTIRITKAAAGYGDSPNILINKNANAAIENAGLVCQSNVVDFASAFTTLKNNSISISQLAARVKLLNANEQPIGSTNLPSQVKIGLYSGINVWNVTGADLNQIQNLTYKDSPGSAQVLVINVDAAGAFTWTTPSLGGVGGGNAPFILWNFYNTTQLTIAGSATIEGSLLAPLADVIKTGNQANIEGQLIANSFVHSGGEMHHYPFNADLSLTNALVAIWGNVFNDANGLVDNTVNGTLVSSLAGNNFSASLVNSSTGKVVSTTLVTNGMYGFMGVSKNTSYSVVLSNTPGTVGATPPSAALTGGVINTGENIGATAGNDGLPNGVIAVAVGTSSVSNVNFGVERLPTADPKTLSGQLNPGGTNKVTVPTLTGSDPEDGTYTGTSKTNTVVIQTLPTGSTGTLYYNSTAVTVGQVIPAYDPSLLTVDPADGPVSVTFTYSERDAAGKDSPPALVTITFINPAPVTVIITGNVFNDANGLVDNTINGTPVSVLSGNIFSANLVSGSTGNVVATTLLTNGTFTFTGVTQNSSYSVVLSNTPGTVGVTPPSAALTGGVINTGENIGATAGNDGLPNGVIAVAVGTSNVTNVNFGVERLPTADPKTAASQANPQEDYTVTVPTLTGSDPEDGTYTGTSKTNTVVIQTLPTGSTGTLYYNSTAVTVGQVIPAYDPSLLTVDPADGPVSVTFTYSERDAAGKDSPPALVTMPFFVVPDLTPIIYARPSTVSGTTPISYVIDVFELNGVATNGLITVRVSKDAKTALSFDNTLTMVGGRPVQNGSWTFAGLSDGFYVLTTNQVIAAGEHLSFGLTGALTPGATTGTLTASVVIKAGSGGEVLFDNNSDADKIDYFQQ